MHLATDYIHPAHIVVAATYASTSPTRNATPRWSSAQSYRATLA